MACSVVCSGDRCWCSVLVFGAGGGNGEGEDHPGQRGVETRVVDGDPEQRAHGQIGGQPMHPGAVEREEHHAAGHRGGEPARDDAGRVEQGDDDDRQQVIDDGDAYQQHSNGDRHPGAEDGQHPNGKRDIRCSGNRPPVQMKGVAPVDQHEDERGNGHAANGSQARQSTAAPGGEFAVEQFLLDFQPHQQEEDRHQAIVDPVFDGEPEDVVMQNRLVGVAQG